MLNFGRAVYHYHNASLDVYKRFILRLIENPDASYSHDLHQTNHWPPFLMTDDHFTLACPGKNGWDCSHKMPIFIGISWGQLAVRFYYGYFLKGRISSQPIDWKISYLNSRRKILRGAVQRENLMKGVIFSSPTVGGGAVICYYPKWRN